ncbi:uncharacterized protein LOC109004570 isoform X3 [Juglans regia]|uniref:Uncharacterized protein LOC109004570 isoform X3 n=1 Tax=Juglans regia TaxID=51240 RepID=A0A6P9EHY6_JUGRE|nr:uncharacterized protein LOC109004570 isoform X3 [Juglans regia]
MSAHLRRAMEKESRIQQEKKLCRRCNQTYTPSSNTPSSCRYHTSFFVCRRHDDQKRKGEQDYSKKVELLGELHNRVQVL